MKKIDKYKNASRPASLAEELQQYKIMATSLRKNGSKARSKKLSQLALVIPFAAASLSPFAVQAQCNAIVTPVGEDFNVDIDANGSVDFTMNANITGIPDLFLNLAAANIEFAAVVAGGYNYPIRFTAGSITSGENWVGGAGVAGTMAYNNYASPQWEGAGIVSGYVALRLDGNRLGFMEVTFDNATGTTTIGDAGVQAVAQAGNTDIVVGVCGLLPVELMRFDGNLEKEKITLEWATSSETNNKGFEIERSMDGINFEKIAFVEGQGNSIESIEYQFEDKNIRSNRKYYYRLNQVDFWNGNAYSELLAFQTERTVSLDISPNPVQGDRLQVNFSADGNDTWEISTFDMRGQLVGEMMSVKGSGNHMINLDIQNLASGAYFVKITSGTISEYKKFIKQN